MKINYILLIGLVILSGCSTPPRHKNTSINDNKVNSFEKQKKSKLMTIHHELIKSRGFFLTSIGNINYKNDQRCYAREIQSHRGLDNNKPENSRASILHALDNDFDVVEIDVMQLRDGTWVLHHDTKTGRATSMPVELSNSEIRRLSKKEWKKLQHRNLSNGELTHLRPPYFIEVAKDFGRFSRQGQRLNIEIKPATSDQSLRLLDGIAQRYISEGNYFYSSSNLSTLKKIRKRQPYMYLSFIQKPDKRSLDILKNSFKSNASEDSIYRKHIEDLASAEKGYNKYYKSKRYDHDDGLNTLTNTLGSNIGLTMDIRQYVSGSSEIYAASQRHNIPIITYSVNGQSYHEKSLLKLNTAHLPKSIIIDDTMYGFCSNFEKIKVNKNFSFTYPEETKRYSLLPTDLDLERLEELDIYYDQGYYPSSNGNLKSIPLTKIKTVTKNITKGERNNDFTGREKEVSFSLETSSTVTIDIKKRKNN